MAIKGLHIVTVKGAKYCYAWRGGPRMKTLPDHPGFNDEYAQLRNEAKKASVVGRRKLRLPRGKRAPTIDDSILAAVRGASARATKSNVPFDLTIDYAKAKIEENGECCEISGIKFVPDYDPDRRFSHNPYGLSIDRIEREKGYVQGNVRFVITAVNFAINQWGLDAYLRICQETVVKNMRRTKRRAA